MVEGANQSLSSGKFNRALLESAIEPKGFRFSAARLNTNVCPMALRPSRLHRPAACYTESSTAS